jgi:hypothetical protein
LDDLEEGRRQEAGGRRKQPFFPFFPYFLLVFTSYFLLIKKSAKILFGQIKADMAELVDAPDLGSGFARSEGSSPFIRTSKKIKCCQKKYFFDNHQVF